MLNFSEIFKLLKSLATNIVFPGLSGSSFTWPKTIFDWGILFGKSSTFKSEPDITNPWSFTFTLVYSPFGVGSEVVKSPLFINVGTASISE